MNEKEINSIVDSVIRAVMANADNMTLDMATALADKVRKKAKEMGVNAVVATTLR